MHRVDKFPSIETEEGINEFVRDIWVRVRVDWVAGWARGPHALVTRSCSSGLSQLVMLCHREEGRRGGGRAELS